MNLYCVSKHKYIHLNTSKFKKIKVEKIHKELESNKQLLIFCDLFFFLLWCDPKNKTILFFNLYFILLSILSNIIFIFKISLWFHFYLLFNFSGTASQTSFSSISWVLTSTCLLVLTRYFNCNLTFLLKLPMLWVLRERTKGRCTTFIILCRIYALSIAIVVITLEFMVLLINTPR